MAATASHLRGYDPEGMTWTTVPTVPTFRHQSLNEAVARRASVQAKTAASTAIPASGTPAGKTQPPVSRAAGGKGKALTNWRPRPLPKPGPDDFVVVLKPREHVSLHQAFSENRYGAAFTAYLGPELAKSVTVPSREQNLVLIHTPNPAVADRLLGEFSVNTEHGDDVCHGVIVVSNSDTTESLREQVRKFGSSNKARVTFAGKVKPRFVHYDNMLIPVRNYYRTIPACGLHKSQGEECGSVGHRADACPNTQPNTCGLCGQQAPLVEGVRAPHECVPRCSVCGGEHATNSRECAAKFRTHKVIALKGGTKKKSATKKKSRHLGLPGESPSRDDNNTAKPAPSTGNDGKRPPTQPPPQGDKGKLSTTPPRGEARTWTKATKHGTQVSGTGRTAPSSPPAARSAEHTKIAALEGKIEMLLKKIALLESKSQVLTNPSSPATEAMESEPTAPTAALSAEAALEARLEARMDARLNALENQISAAITSAIAKMTETIPTIIAQHLAQSSRSVRRAGGLIKDVSGRYPKTSRRAIENDVDDDDSCTLTGIEDATLAASAGSAAASLQPLFNFNDHGGQPSS
ncbi:hypothetical protein HPB50_002713 [Hyalomma asiaticum]|uniref:Uncharacterized protein n=1 Tax=Hyalomma asiaticum TaxID=266040 RepID=A0ACB7TBZ8_HYAAI|nr:hypothetical protein HPB50_002713 [Hyalomma asiaticum]